MEKLIQPIRMINGYKQILGLVIFGIGSAMKAAGYAELGIPLLEFGGVLAGVGAMHKAFKQKKA